jgi:hypothetical protein
MPAKQNPAENILNFDAKLFFVIPIYKLTKVKLRHKIKNELTILFIGLRFEIQLSRPQSKALS